MGILLFLLMVVPVFAADLPCPGENSPPPPILKADIPALLSSLETLRDTQGRKIWKTDAQSIIGAGKAPSMRSLSEIFESVPARTKLEQFFQLLFLLQKDEVFPLKVLPPSITDVLVAARVFKSPDFPSQITSVELLHEDARRPPLYRVQFSKPEVRFVINEGQGFATWDQGMCQMAKELIFYPGFSFRIRKAKNSKNLIVYDFDKVEIFGQFGTRKILTIDLNYVDLERVEFIAGTDQGKVTARVAQREFKENQHSRLFRFVGSLIPNTSQQRIDW